VLLTNYSIEITNNTDEKLILLYKEQKDAAIIAELYKRYSTLVYGVSLKYLKDRELAKDATMQLFEKLFSSLLVHEVTYFKSWLYTSARNHCLMQLRSQKGKKAEALSPFLVESEADVHLNHGQELEENLSKLENCIQKLNAEQKQCVQLFFLQQQCYQDVAKTTGFDLNQVKSYIQNGKRNLKICLERNE
jgi:RNA polymerase sigma factor (sigma-70 family)